MEPALTSNLAPADLPPVVLRYFGHVLGDTARMIRQVRMSQSGVLRASLQSNRWMKFEARQSVQPDVMRFCWDARVRVMPLVRLQVRDAYGDGAGSGRVRLASMITVASDRDRPELNAAALHRYLAEAVWYPTALLPATGVQWTPIDAHRALATLTDASNTVSLEFRFNEAAEVSGVYTPGRWARSGKGYALTAWEGHFRDYRRCQGILVPGHGEVGWYADDRLEMVWKGDVTSLVFGFEQTRESPAAADDGRG